MPISNDLASTMAGFTAGIVNALAVGPLDVVKARQQIQKRVGDPKKLRYRGTMTSLSRIYGEEGVRGLYRGFPPTLVSYLPAWTLYFTLYNRARAKFKDSMSKNQNIVVSAVLAGGVTNSATNPLWVIRTRLQTQEHVERKPEYAGTWDAAKKIYKREGVRAFYKGMVPSMWGLIHVAVQFPLYEKFKSRLGISDDDDKESQNRLLTLDHALRLIAASSLSKLIASLSTYPLEVVRTRMHVQRSDGVTPMQYLSVRGSLSTILKEEGVQGVYSGLQTNLFRVVPACAITFTTYEMVYRWIKTEL